MASLPRHIVHSGSAAPGALAAQQLAYKLRVMGKMGHSDKARLEGDSSDAGAGSTASEEAPVIMPFTAPGPVPAPAVQTHRSEDAASDVVQPFSQSAEPLVEVELAPVEVEGAVEEEITPFSNASISPQATEPVSSPSAEEVQQAPDPDKLTKLAGVDLFTAEYKKSVRRADQQYISDLLNGMLETKMERLRLNRDERLPYFGFLLSRPLPASYDGILRYIGQSIGADDKALAYGAEGVMRASATGDDDLVQLMFGVEVGPRTSWIRFTRQVEGRVLKKEAGS